MMTFQEWARPRKSVQDVYSIGYVYIYILYILIGLLILYTTYLTYDFAKNAENTFKNVKSIQESNMLKNSRILEIRRI